MPVMDYDMRLLNNITDKKERIPSPVFDLAIRVELIGEAFDGTATSARPDTKVKAKANFVIGLNIFVIEFSVKS